MYRVLIRKPDTNGIVITRYYETLEGYTKGLNKLISHKGNYYRIQGYQLINLTNMNWYILTNRPPGSADPINAYAP